MPFTDDDLLPISALQHLLFCERQCALIHIERLWVENRFTAEGQVLHRQAHEGKSHTRDGVRITRGLPLTSYQHGLIGKVDVVEFRPPDGLSARDQNRSLASVLREEAVTGLTGWTVTPIEYKRGRPKQNDCDRVQLCAQAICLEEMLQIEIPAGLLFYGQRPGWHPSRVYLVPADFGLRDGVLMRPSARLRASVDVTGARWPLKGRCPLGASMARTSSL